MTAPMAQPSYIQPAIQPQPAIFGGAGFGMTANRPLQAAGPVPVQAPFGVSMKPNITATVTSSTAAPRPGMQPTVGTAAKPTANFDDIWSMSLGSSAVRPASASGGKSIKDLEKEKANAGLWGNSVQAAKPAAGAFGTFGGGGVSMGSGLGGAASSSLSNNPPGGNDDLLL